MIRLYVTVLKKDRPLAVFRGISAPFTAKHSEIRWNPELEEWFCVRCGRTSDHVGRDDAQTEMELFECQLPSTEGPEQLG
jgi:hypothetical protein